ncbi:MAG: hypothetical protein IJ593_04815 [Lachnospiraceae bacterium]|nr:hypothetical protein [Lachnospiraceae bacterium]
MDENNTVSNIIDSFNNSGLTVEDEEVTKRVEHYKTVSKSILAPAYLETVRQDAVNKNLIPAVYKNSHFDSDKIKNNIEAICKRAKHKVQVTGYDEYIKTCTDIISAVRLGTLPDKSYLIGAPQGFGKQSFATDLIVYSLAHSWVTVPYMSLSEIAEIKATNDRIIHRDLMGYDTRLTKRTFDIALDADGNELVSPSYYTMPTELDSSYQDIVLGQYSWSHFINAPILVCFFSGIESKVVESYMLSTLLNIRGAKGYPTIALISTSLDPYKKDPFIGRHIWAEILNTDPDFSDLCRVYHTSTYKKYNI